jgi:carbon monoxide dehydrogenase subunit G
VRLEFSDTLAVAAPPQRVWQRLMDPAFVAAAAPGVEGVERVDDTRFRVKAMLGVGSVSLRFAIDVELADLVPPSSARMMVKGSAPGSALHADSSVRLSPLDGGTDLAWTVGAEVRGTLASTGARLLKGTARKLTGAFWKTFAKRVAKAER